MDVFDNNFELLDEELILWWGVGSDGVADEGVEDTLHEI